MRIVYLHLANICKSQIEKAQRSLMSIGVLPGVFIIRARRLRANNEAPLSPLTLLPLVLICAVIARPQSGRSNLESHPERSLVILSVAKDLLLIAQQLLGDPSLRSG